MLLLTMTRDRTNELDKACHACVLEMLLDADWRLSNGPKTHHAALHIAFGPYLSPPFWLFGKQSDSIMLPGRVKRHLAKVRLIALLVSKAFCSVRAPFRVGCRAKAFLFATKTGYSASEALAFLKRHSRRAVYNG